MQKILAISGRKQSGKDTCFKFIKQIIPDAKHFYFADPLKRICIDILGCPEEKVYGTDSDKNEKVPHLLWENFPVSAYTKPNGSVFTGVPNGRFNLTVFDPPPDLQPLDIHCDGIVFKGEMPKIDFQQPLDLPISPSQISPFRFHDGDMLKPLTGPMSVREVLQYWGTEVFRKAYHNVWADACIRAIRKDGCEFAVITDCRFPNEVDVAKAEGGKVVRLTRNVFPDDAHASETALDVNRYNWSNFDEVIYNEDIGVKETCLRILKFLMDNQWYNGPLSFKDFIQYAEKAAA
jgi:hypothetical protein